MLVAKDTLIKIKAMVPPSREGPLWWGWESVTKELEKVLSHHLMGSQKERYV